jgi:hypothetical protein
MRFFLIILFLSNKLSSQSDYSHNWNTNQNSISIDFAFVQSDSTLVGENYFNYNRVYADKSVIEYGNIKQGMANGRWIYYGKNGQFLTGWTESGFKIGSWKVVSGINAGSFYVYEWDAQKTETKISKSKTVFKKVNKSKKGSAGKIIAK